MPNPKPTLRITVGLLAQTCEMWAERREMLAFYESALVIREEEFQTDWDEKAAK
jgi:hypothetical protein